MTQEPNSSFPSFFREAPTIRVHDPLASFLGAGDGFIEYGYADAVKLAGHSCPTVASAFLMTRAALAALYPDTAPRRGELRVELREPLEEGVTGVIGNVAGFLTGAAGDGGFQGIAGRFGRRRLLAFGVAMEPQLRVTRLDSGASVGVSARIDRVAGDPRLRQLMPRCVGGIASAEELALFGSLWQERVRRLLLEHADDPEVIAVQHEESLHG
ncbi:hypothetical protein GCM10028796_58590 [Ramlibacter monticola]|uniref:Formylmethanofuran dehydrogenase subunit E domain-containing protein n=1 Tax=Ramlibacter monticola TaxID=1926872 RepID=A0A936Z448_9BURK|nr:hypothetical protein [Ramlibacter monticola]MBL0394002.1 hypothetical protein [Ramlibacter monticola]